MSNLSSARQRLVRAKEILGDSCCVALSGGKDSLVILDLACEVFTKVEAFHMYLVRGLRCIEDHVDAAARRVNVPVHYVPHFELARMFRAAFLRPALPASAKIRLLAQRDVERAMTKRTGSHLFCYGDRASDSFVRRFYTRENDGLRLRAERTKVYPIWDWKDADVYAYLKAKKIPLPPRFGTERKQSGFYPNPECLRWLKDKHPHDYQKVLSVFPYASTLLVSGPDGVPGVQGRAGRTWADFRREVEPAENQRGREEEAQESA